VDATHVPGVDVVTAHDVLPELRRAIADVPDPEIPVVTIDDLGILRDVSLDSDTIVVTLTPTYSGCPAMAQIAEDVREAARPFGEVRVEMVYHPPWTTDWISRRGKEALRAHGIAPPPAVGSDTDVLCPRCDSAETTTVSWFGSTACKALLVCASCREPFDLFKAL
jgi:ring-1,2-phenylacetyl-CoA epoxidase subunit PaaD